MGSTISILATKKVNQEKILLDLTRAAFHCGYSFSLGRVEEKKLDEKTYLNPISFMIPPQKEGQEWLSFSFVPIQEQGLLAKEFQTFYLQNGERIYFNEIHYLAAADNVDSELSFQLIYEYLKINKLHFVDIDFIIDWPLMQEIYESGYSETWCWRKS
jgi:hypothetical protein